MSVFKELSLSLYSKDFYNETAATKRGIGFGFLVLISAFSTITAVIGLYIALSLVDGNGLDKFIKQIPQVTVTKGELSIDQPTPYYMNDGDVDVLVIDTSDAALQKSADAIFEEMKSKNLIIYATRTKVYSAKENQSKFEVHDLKQYQSDDFTFNKDDVREWVKIAKKVALPFIAIFVFIFMIVYQLIRALIYSVFAIIINNMLNKNLAYETLQRLTTYAIWPSVLLSVIFAIGNVSYPFFASLLVTVGYIYFAINSADALASTTPTVVVTKAPEAKAAETKTTTKKTKK